MRTRGEGSEPSLGRYHARCGVRHMRPLRHIYRRPKLATHLQLPQFGSRLEHFDPTHVRPQYLWHRDAAVGILVVLQNRYQRTAYR